MTCYDLRVVVPPIGSVLTVDDIRSWCRVDFHDDDTVLEMCVAAATTRLDGWDGILGRAILTQTWERSMDCFPAAKIRLPLGPVQSVVSVSYVDSDGATQIVDPADYRLVADGYEADVSPVSAWPSGSDVKVRFVCGFGEGIAVPAPIRVDIARMASYFYEHREMAAEKNHFEGPVSMHMLSGQYRRVLV